MRIDVHSHKYSQSSTWEEEKPQSKKLIYKIPPKGTPTIEVLLTDPPQYRINGHIIDVPEGMSPEEYYERYMGGHIYKEDNKKDIDPQFSRTPKKSYRNINHGFSREEKEDSFDGLHPLRKQYLENRLKDLDYQERQQMMQNSFTTVMYGKKDYTEERDSILRVSKDKRKTPIVIFIPVTNY